MEVDQYLDVFIDESMEHLDVLYNQLLALENNPSEKAVIEEIFRAAHTIKGMSATMGYEDVANLTHYMENVLDDIRYEKITVQANTIDVLFSAVDLLNEMVQDIANGGDGKRDVSEVVHFLSNIGESVQRDENTEGIKQELKPKEEEVIFTELDEYELAILRTSSERNFKNYEIEVELEESCLLKGARVFMVFEVLEQLGEIIKTEPSVNDLEEENFSMTFSILLVSNSEQDEISSKIGKVSEVERVSVRHFTVNADTAKDNSNEVEQEIVSNSGLEAKQSAAVESPNQVAGRKTIRVNIDRLDLLMNLFEELVIDRGRLEQISLELNNRDLQETVEQISHVSANLQNVILNMRMVPINHVFNRFPGMIRQLARELEKEIKVEIIGAETELDRTVIDEIGDPLVHLIRNATDHGIETIEERIKKGKPQAGTIKLHAYHSGNYIFIEISDDGSGINKEKVLHKSLSNGIIDQDQANLMSEQQIYELIMASGFSTTDSVSDISGRGVGLDVVKNTIETLGGSITIHSELEKGSTFSIQLPLTLSIMSVLLVQLEDEKYAIPLSSIIETVVIHQDEILHAHNKKVIDFRGSVVPLIFLKEVFAVPIHQESAEHLSVVIVKRGDKTAGLVVDSLIGQQEVVLKSLGSYLANIPAISGATILGDGEVALIIDSNALIK